MEGIRACNPVVGCTEGCPWCRSATLAVQRRLSSDFSKPEFHERRLRMLPTNTASIFDLCSMSDLADWKNGWCHMIFAAMAKNPQHRYLLSTNRPGRVFLDEESKRFLESADNVWVGTSVIVPNQLERIEAMHWNIPARHYYVDFEPLLGSMDGFNPIGVGWVVVGALTGPMAPLYPTMKRWVLDLISVADDYTIPVAMRDNLRSVVGSDLLRNDIPFKP